MTSAALITGQDGSYPPDSVLSRGDVVAMAAEPSKAKRLWGWEPKTTREFPHIMVDAGVRSVEHELAGKLVRIDR